MTSSQSRCCRRRPSAYVTIESRSSAGVSVRYELAIHLPLGLILVSCAWQMRPFTRCVVYSVPSLFFMVSSRYFAHVFAYPFRFFGIRTVVYPVEHAEVRVLPRGAVDDFAVCGDAAGHAAVPHLLVTVVEVGPGKFVRHTVRPQQRLAQPLLLYPFTRITYPILTVGRSTLDVGLLPKPAGASGMKILPVRSMAICRRSTRR